MNLLVVDDMLVTRKMVRTAAEALGVMVYEAKDGFEAFTVLNQTSGRINLIFLDWNMPNMDGFEFLKRIKGREEYKKIPVVMTTAVSERENIIKAIKAGAAQYLVKPFSQEAVAKKIMELTDENVLIMNLIFAAFREGLGAKTGLEVEETPCRTPVSELDYDIFFQFLLCGENHILIYCTMNEEAAERLLGAENKKPGERTPKVLLEGLAKFFMRLSQNNLPYSQGTAYKMAMLFCGQAGETWSTFDDKLLRCTARHYQAGETAVTVTLCRF